MASTITDKERMSVDEGSNCNTESQDRYCLARTERALELFQLPYDTPSMLAAGVEVLWQKALDIVIYQGHSYQVKPSDRTALIELGWDGKLLCDDDLERVEKNEVRAANKDNNTAGANVSSSKNKINIETDKQSDLTLEERVWVQLRTCYDPEIAVNIVDLGLIYHVLISTDKDGGQSVTVKMTLTNPACNMGDIIIQEMKEKITALPEVKNVTVELVFDPPWSYDLLSDQAKLELGLL